MSIRTKIAMWALRGLHPRDPALAEWLAYANTAAGISVTPTSAMRVAAVYSCIRVLSETLASLPLKVYKRQHGGGREVATDHWLHSIVHGRPNGWMTSFGWREMGLTHQCLRGVSYSEIQADGFGNRRLIPYHPDRVRERLVDDKFVYEVRLQNGGTKVLLHDEMLRLPFATLDGIKPVTPIELQRETLGAAIAAQDYSSRFWANDTRPTGGLLEHEGAFSSDDAKKKFMADFKEQTSGANRHSTVLLPAKMKFNSVSMNMEDAQFIETRKLQRSEIAGFFRVPPHMIGDLDRATFSNVEQQSIDFVVYTMQPWFSRWEQGLGQGLLTDAEQEDYYVEFSVDGLLRGDAAARANYFRTAILTGWLSRNEVREMENRNRVEGLDEYLSPLNMAPADLLAEFIASKVSGQSGATQ